MKKNLSLILALLLILSVALTACNKPKQHGEFFLTAEISSETQAEADAVLSQFMTALEENTPSKATGLLHSLSNLEPNEEHVSAFFEEIHRLADAPFVPYDSYYMTGLTPSEAPLKFKKSETDANYIELAPLADELYYAMYVSEGKHTSLMISFILARENGKFKIAWIAPTDFKYDGEDAPAIYKKTQALDNDGKVFSAFISSCKLGNIVRPGDFFRYPNDLEMEDICYKLISELAKAYPLPIKLENTTESFVYSIGIENDENHGIIPLICYKTSASVSDEASLRTESEKVVASLKTLFPDLAENADYICFKATSDDVEINETPQNVETITLEIK